MFSSRLVTSSNRAEIRKKETETHKSCLFFPIFKTREKQPTITSKISPHKENYMPKCKAGTVIFTQTVDEFNKNAHNNMHTCFSESA